MAQLTATVPVEVGLYAHYGEQQIDVGTITIDVPLTITRP